MSEYFADYHIAGVAARVAIHLVKRARRDPAVRDLQPWQQPMAAVDLLDGVSFVFVRMALHSMSVYVQMGKSSREWLSGVVYRDLMGYTFRRCFFDAYKETRRLTPRITNRGGQTSLFAEDLPLEKGNPDVTSERTDVNQSDSRDRLDQWNATKRRTRLSDLDR